MLTNSVWKPQNQWLLAGVCLVQIMLIALPFFKHMYMPAIVVLLLISTVALLGSLSLAMLYLCFACIVIPTWFWDDFLSLPMGLKFYEGIFAVIASVAAVTWLMEGRLDWRRPTHMDRAILFLLGYVIFSCGLGLLYGQSTSQMMRDVRYPLYYAGFFVVTWFFDLKYVSAFLHLLIVAAVVVGIEYLVEFFLGINASLVGTFFRVARLEGVILPIGTLIIAALLLYEPQKHRRILASAALLPIGLALILTMGRGMWIALIVGLGTLTGLVFLDARAAGKRASRLVLVMLIPIFLVGIGAVFQWQTRAGVSEMATRRITRVTGDYEQDHSVVGRLLSYKTALEKILRRPLLGWGHGVTVAYVIPEAFPPEIMRVGGVDNVYLTIGLRMGIVGIGLFLWVYCWGLLRAYRLFQQTTDPNTKAFCSAFMIVYCAMLVYGVADATLFVNRLIFVHATFLGLLARLDVEHMRKARFEAT